MTSFPFLETISANRGAIIERSLNAAGQNTIGATLLAHRFISGFEGMSTQTRPTIGSLLQSNERGNLAPADVRRLLLLLCQNVAEQCAAANTGGAPHANVLMDIVADIEDCTMLSMPPVQAGSNQTPDALIDTLMVALASVDGPSALHSRAVGQWCEKIATTLQFGNDAIEFVRRCGILHDIGKLAVPRAILTKPGPLTAEEWDLIRRHPEDGSKIVSQLPPLQRYAAVIASHHERFDGKGYPFGLAGSNIPIEARIVAVADSFHAMITTRPYAAARSISEALFELMKCSTTQFDPQIVDAMVATLSAKPKQVAARSRSIA